MKIGLKLHKGKSAALVVDGHKIDAQGENEYLFLDDVGPGPHVIVYE